MHRLFAVFIAALLAVPALAQDRRPSHCIALAQATPGIAYLHQASWQDPLPDYTVRFSYIDHSSFLIQTPGGATAVTDYTGFLGAVDFVPDVVSMNNAHSTHWTANPDPRIPHVLNGWAIDGVAAEHDVFVRDLRVRNVPTNVREWATDGVRQDGNSIFVFEVEGLCIGHLGHLHHEPTPEQYAALGRVDVVMAAVDGGLTLDVGTLKRVLDRLRASVVIPMHWRGTYSLDAFLSVMTDTYKIERLFEPSLTVSLRDLPSEPTIRVLSPAFLRVEDDE